MIPEPVSKPTIAVDIDDVLALNAQAFVEFSNQRWGTNLRVEDYNDHWGEIWKVGREEHEKRSQEYNTSGVLSQYRSFPYAKKVLQQLAKRYNLVTLTGRMSVTNQETKDWIDKNFGRIFSGTHFAGIWDRIDENTPKATKTTVAKQIGADYLIDDQPKHCIAAAEAGIKTVMFGDYKWNRDVKLLPNMVRAKNWQEVLEYFDAQDR